MEKQTMSVQELSSQMGISLPKAYELVKEPGFPTIRIVTRILIPVEAYREWLLKTSANNKNKKLLYHDKEDWQIFENTHEPIIDGETFKIVQRIRDGRRRHTNMGEMPVLSGMLFCADYGQKLYQVRHADWTYDKHHFVCGTYRKVKGGCRSHRITNVAMEQILLSSIRDITSYAREHEKEFVALAAKKSQSEMSRNQRRGKRELEQSRQRIAKLDTIIQRLYEDNIEGKISDERFATMSQSYEDEQAALKTRIADLESELESEKEKFLNMAHFLSLVKRYTDIQELSAEIVREFVEKVFVHHPEKVDGQKQQRIRSIWNCIGEFTPPQAK